MEGQHGSDGIVFCGPTQPSPRCGARIAAETQPDGRFWLYSCPACGLRFRDRVYGPITVAMDLERSVPQFPSSEAADLAWRMADRVQLTTDGYRAYPQAVPHAFGEVIDFAVLLKLFGHDSIDTTTTSRPSASGRSFGARAGTPILSTFQPAI
jgi:hypothetical protein